MIGTELQHLAESKFKNAACIVIKIGSALLIDRSTNAVRLDWLKSIADDVNIMIFKPGGAFILYEWNA